MTQSVSGDAITVISILLFADKESPSGIFLMEMPNRMIFRWQHVNRNRANPGLSCYGSLVEGKGFEGISVMATRPVQQFGVGNLDLVSEAPGIRG